jgi:hypothetical protein
VVRGKSEEAACCCSGSSFGEKGQGSADEQAHLANKVRECFFSSRIDTSDVCLSKSCVAWTRGQKGGGSQERDKTNGGTVLSAVMDAGKCLDGGWERNTEDGMEAERGQVFPSNGHRALLAPYSRLPLLESFLPSPGDGTMTGTMTTVSPMSW